MYIKLTLIIIIFFRIMNKYYNLFYNKNININQHKAK